MLYQVTVREILERQINITAPTEIDAVKKVQEMYNNEEIVLDYSDHSSDTEFDVKPLEK